MKTYSILVNYNGFGSMTIYLPKKGDTLISQGRPIYISNADISVIEALRSYRSLGIDISIGASSKGAYKTIDYGEIPSIVQRVARNKTTEVLTNNDISDILKAGSSGPIEVLGEQVEGPGGYILPSGTYVGKTIKEVYDLGKLKYVRSGFRKTNPSVAAVIEEFYKNIEN